MKTFQQLQQELEHELQEIIGFSIDNQTLKYGQSIVNRHFLRLRLARTPVVIENIGVMITGLTLTIKSDNHLVSIVPASWTTVFWPRDQYNVLTLEPNAVALGYYHDYQLYITQPDLSQPGYLVARLGPGSVDRWQPSTQGMPPLESVFFVALERAKVLGHLYTLQTRQ